MPKLNRRDFLKALGVTGSASALAACGLDTNRYKTPVEHIIPYVVKPDQVTPGTPTFFATSITRGPSARSVTARHREGRVINVSHNRYAGPRASIGSAALLELQKHYSPERIKGPTDAGQPVAWDAGLAKLAEAVKAARDAGKKIAFVGAYKSGPIVDLLKDFATDAVFWEPLGYEADVAAAAALFGRGSVPYYGVDKAGYVLSFGAPFLSGTWGDAGLQERYATARNPNVDKRVARFALLSPLRDQTGVNADDWFAVAPGQQVLVARAIAKLVAERNGASDAIKALIGDVSVEQAAGASGVTAEDLKSIAENFVAGQGVAIPGGPTGSTDLAVATYLINLAGGAAGDRFNLGGFQGPVDGWARLAALIADLDAGKVGVLILDDANPVYALPDDAKFADAVKKADLLVSVSSHPDETTSLATLVLPASDTFEDWGAETPISGTFLVRQPAMTPVYDTRSLGDILLGVGRAAGLNLPAVVADYAPGTAIIPVATTTLGFNPPTWREYVASWWQAQLWDGVTPVPAFWEKSVVEGLVVKPQLDAYPTLSAATYAWTDDAIGGTGEWILLAHPHHHRHDGRYANQPWAQEVPDALTGTTWTSVLVMSAEQAAQLQVVMDDVVTVTSESGSFELPVYPLPGVTGNNVSIAFGQGHTGNGRYADGRGVNVAKAFKVAVDGKGSFSWAPQRVTLQKAAKKVIVAHTMSVFGMSDAGRNFGAIVSAEKIAAVGDAVSEEPGSLTGIHEMEMDPRLTEKGITNFYELPDHPTYRFGLTVDTNSCNGCGSCIIACYAENNLPIVGPDQVSKGREMAWIRVDRFWENDVGGKDDIRFVPMMCQQCGHAGCENVCPVLATYHNLDGLNAMVYNRCVGTRYCSNACPYSVRRFNFHTFTWPEPFNLQLNPDVSARTMGVMEKCTFCVQRIRATKSAWKDRHGLTAVVPDAELNKLPACVEACPSQAMTFGNLKDEASLISLARKSARTYEPLKDLNAMSAVNYLAKANFHADPTADHHGGGEEHAEGSAEAAAPEAAQAAPAEAAPEGAAAAPSAPPTEAAPTGAEAAPVPAH